MKQTALKRDEEQVQAIVNHVNETMTDPFDVEAHPPCLMNISTCMRSTGLFAVCCQRRLKQCRNFVTSALSVGDIPEMQIW